MYDELKKDLLKHEGLRLKPYKDTVGKLTIGIGRNLDDVGISEEEAFYLLENDIKKVVDQVTKRFKWFQDLNDVRQDVILNMVFNLGIKKFSEFKMTIYFLEEKQYDQAAIEMIESSWATQVGQRAKELSKMMLTGCRS